MRLVAFAYEGVARFGHDNRMTALPKVGFICSANLCRSPMAHAIFAAEVDRRGLRIASFSAGIWDFEGEEAALAAMRACERHHTPMPKLLATHHSNVDLSDVTRVFVMQDRHVEALREETMLPPERISLLGDFDPQQRGAEIDDPIGKEEAAFEACYLRMRDCIHHYLDTTMDFSPDPRT